MRENINIVIISTKCKDTDKKDFKLDYEDDEYVKRIMDIFKGETKAAKIETKLHKNEVRKRNEHGKLRVKKKGDHPEDSSSSEDSDNNEINYGKKYTTSRENGKKNGEEREKKKEDTPKEENKIDKNSKEREEKIITLTSESDDEE